MKDLNFVSKPDTPLEVYFKDNSPQFVTAPEVKKPDKPAKDEVKLKSNQTNRTNLESWKQTVPSHMTSTGFNSEGKQQKNLNLEKKEQSSKKQIAKNETGDFSVTDERVPLPLPGFGSSSSPPKIPSYIQEKMPAGIKLGNITSLNTDQHRFYSFNQRLLSRFVPNWGNMVSRALYQWLQDNNFPPVSKSWVTQVEVVMNKKGEILDIQPFRLSGLWAIDESAIKAFKMVKNVPNPPEEMVDENGYIHLQFQTEVYWVPQPGVRFHGGGPGQKSN